MQGVGSVGGGLARYLAAEGARLTIADINTDRARKLADETRGMIVPADEIMAAEADVFSPCALGAVLDKDSIGKLKAGIVAGGANNQLATKSDGSHMRTRNILRSEENTYELRSLMRI